MEEARKMKTSTIMRDNAHVSYQNQIFHKWDNSSLLHGIFIQNVVRIFIANHYRTYDYR